MQTKLRQSSNISSKNLFKMIKRIKDGRENCLTEVIHFISCFKYLKDTVFLELLIVAQVTSPIHKQSKLSFPQRRSTEWRYEKSVSVSLQRGNHSFRTTKRQLLIKCDEPIL